MAHLERSAGFVIYHQNAQQGPVEFLLLDYRRHWDFPKGHVEAGEDDLDRAHSREASGKRPGMKDAPQSFPAFMKR